MKFLKIWGGGGGQKAPMGKYSSILASNQTPS